MWNSVKKMFDSPDSYVSLALGLAVVLVVGMLSFNYFKTKAIPSTKTDEKVEATKEAAQNTKLPTKHTVKKGETLWSVAQDYYKSGYNWVDIAKANTLSNANVLTEGMELTIPDVKPISPTSEVSSAQTAKKEYTVKKGDSLWAIAVSQYNNGYRWPEIARANNLKDPNVIHVGNVLMLP